jgi:hypothetical protein
VFAGPVHLSACTDFQEKLEFFRKERVVVLETQAEEWTRFNERTTTGENFGAAPGDEVKSRELLKNANGVSGAANRDRTGETNIFRARGGSGEDYNGYLIEEFRTVMFANVDDVQTNTTGELNFLQ